MANGYKQMRPGPATRAALLSRGYSDCRLPRDAEVNREAALLRIPVRISLPPLTRRDCAFCVSVLPLGEDV